MLLNDDRDVVKYLKFFTFLSKGEIDDLAAKVKTEPEKREAQKALAAEVTRFVHGQAALDEAIKISNILFSGDIKQLTTAEVQDAFNDVPHVEIDAQPQNVVELLVNSGIESSKRQAREDVTNGAITINGDRITDTTAEIDPASHFDGKYVVIRRGKKKYFLAKVK